MVTWCSAVAALVYCCLDCLALAKGSLGALERLVQSGQSDAKQSSEPSQIETYAPKRLGSLDVWDASERLCRCRVLILSLADLTQHGQCSQGLYSGWRSYVAPYQKAPAQRPTKSSQNLSLSKGVSKAIQDLTRYV